MSAIFSVFGSTAWAAESVKTFPNDVIPTNTGEEFLRVTIIPSGKSINRNSASGICIIDIFTAFGQGPARAFEIADILDRHLESKTVGNLQLLISTLVPMGKDKDNQGLARSQYTIPFNLFGVE